MDTLRLPKALTPTVRIHLVIPVEKERRSNLSCVSPHSVEEPLLSSDP